MFVMPIWSFRPLEFELYVIAHECVATLECDATREFDAAHLCDTTLKYEATHACDVVATVVCGNSYGCEVDTARECNNTLVCDIETALGCDVTLECDGWIDIPIEGYTQHAYGRVEITILVYTSYRISKFHIPPSLPERSVVLRARVKYDTLGSDLSAAYSPYLVPSDCVLSEAGALGPPHWLRVCELLVVLRPASDRPQVRGPVLT